MGAKATCWPVGALPPAREPSQNQAFPESSGCGISKEVSVGLELDGKTHESGIDFRPNTDSFKRALQTLSRSGAAHWWGLRRVRLKTHPPAFLCKANLRLDWGKVKQPQSLCPSHPSASAVPCPLPNVGPGHVPTGLQVPGDRG